eukprot:CAMPEP_0171622800 /NCGR_PEP_ID=MMETSP0990-20121206/17503_1 /TAXON_ID=483369 /ORGANISM="non described non described, Strain CCMP2098" /LENGTH=281 /DNA_ID=CAMNT_0012188755 /DNA_START=43 /DNA_END=888 /DNA_ORIENTATION=-
MPSIVGKSTRVVDADGLTIDELAGNVASSSDRFSVAMVSAAAGTSEPWLTLSYDEWICVTSGNIVLLQEGKPDLTVLAGQTVHIEPGTRFRPTFPCATEYIPVCIPAFKPERCVREDETEVGLAIGTSLRKLHDGDAAATSPTSTENPKPEVLYHMTTRAQWEAAKSDGGAYYPTTFEVDGNYTHATGVPSRLITTANHFYQDVPGEWVCVAFTRTALTRSGIYVKDEQALPVGDTAVGSDWGDWICPHIIGGIPVAIVDKEYAMIRNGEKFLGIEGLVDA